MKKEEYLSEEKYQKNKKKIITSSLVVLIIGLLLGGSIIGVGLVKQNKINNNYSTSSKNQLTEKLKEEKQKLIANKETLEEKIKPVEDEIESLERTTFNGFDAAYYERQDKIKDLEKSIKEDKEAIEAIDKALSSTFSSCDLLISDNTYTENYCSIKKQLDDINDEFNKKQASFSCIPFYMFGGFIIVASCMIAGSIYTFAKRREILAFSAQQVMPVAQEGIDKMAPAMGNVAKEITKGIKDGLKDEEK